MVELGNGSVSAVPLLGVEWYSGATQKSAICGPLSGLVQATATILVLMLA